MAVVLIGAAMGWWMFGVRGAGLFAGAALGFLVLFRVIGQRTENVASAIALVAAALALHSASTLGWGGTDAPDGSRYKASPVGLSHVLTPDRPTSETEDCGWYAASGYATPCRTTPEGESAFLRLRAVYPLTLLGAGAAAAGALMSVSRRLRVFQRAAGAGAAGASLLALVLFATSAGTALAALAGLPFGVGGALGAMQVSLAILLGLTVAVSPPHDAAPRVRVR